MRFAEMLLPEFDREIANTRKALERVPEGKFDWKPHEKSMKLGRLAQHLAELPGWATHAVELESLDIAPPGSPPLQPTFSRTRQEMLDTFDKNVSAARSAIARASDEHLRKPWTLLAGGRTIFQRPRIDVIRNDVMNHLVHHRAQLGVYLRLNDVPVPGFYGPSADEGAM